MSGAGNNPWQQVTAGDYDGHMTSRAVAQAPALDRIFAEVLGRYRPSSLAVPGCGTGTGLRHIDPTVTTRVLAVDLNSELLQTARERHGHRLANLELAESDLETMTCPGRFDLVHVALVLEHTDPTLVLPTLARWLLPAATMTIVLQLPSADTPPASQTPFASLQDIGSHMHLRPPGEIRALAAEQGLSETDSSHIPLPAGKSFHVAHFQSTKPA